MPDDVRRLDPPRLVLVERNGQWWPGTQAAWTRWPDGGWRASVRYSTGPGSVYMQDVPAERVRLRQGCKRDYGALPTR